jgi:hypothetical protein
MSRQQASVSRRRRGTDDLKSASLTKVPHHEGDSDVHSKDVDHDTDKDSKGQTNPSAATQLAPSASTELSPAILTAQPTSQRLGREFFDVPGEDLARALLGQKIVRMVNSVRLVVAVFLSVHIHFLSGL